MFTKDKQKKRLADENIALISRDKQKTNREALLRDEGECALCQVSDCGSNALFLPSLKMIDYRGHTHTICTLCLHFSAMILHFRCMIPMNRIVCSNPCQYPHDHPHQRWHCTACHIETIGNRGHLICVRFISSVFYLNAYRSCFHSRTSCWDQNKPTVFQCESHYAYSSGLFV